MATFFGQTPDHGWWQTPVPGGEFDCQALEVINASNRLAEAGFPFFYRNAVRSRLIEQHLMGPAGISSLAEFAQEVFVYSTATSIGRGKLGPVIPGIPAEIIAKIVPHPFPTPCSMASLVPDGEQIKGLLAVLARIKDVCPPPPVDAEHPQALGFLAAWHPQVLVGEDGAIKPATVVGWTVDADTLSKRFIFDHLLPKIVRAYPLRKNRIVEAWRTIDATNPDPIWRLIHTPNPSASLAEEAFHLVQQLQPSEAGPQLKHPQQLIWNALFERCLTGPELQQEVHLGRRGLQSALKPLQDEGLVKNVRGKGYFRPDALPLDAAPGEFLVDDQVPSPSPDE